MKYNFIILFLLSSLQGLAQADSSWLTKYRQALVSIGYIKQVKSKNMFEPVGTGIIMYIKTDDSEIIPCLITAKHVLIKPDKNWNPNSLQLRFYGCDTLDFTEYLGVKITVKNKGVPSWIELEDNNVDLACIPLLYDIIKIRKDEPISFTPIPYGAIAGDEDVYDGKDVFVLGFPTIAPKYYLIKSILRKGTMSWTSPTDPLTSPFLIDCNIFPGNSGGPVFTLPYGLEKNGTIKTSGYVKFAGIVTKVYNEPNSSFDSSGNKVYDNNNRLIYFKQRAALGVVEPAHNVRLLLELTKSRLKTLKK